jgi:hypothetical protein
VLNWVEYATGANAPLLLIRLEPLSGRLEWAYERATLASAAWQVQAAQTLPDFLTLNSGLTLIERVSLPGGRERLVFRGPALAPETRGYHRLRVTPGQP